MENDLISRSALLEAMRFVIDDSTCPMHIAAEIDQIVDFAPAVDAVEVVRCKDCVYYLESNRFCCHIDGMPTAQDEMSFCSYGERRADDGE